LSSQADVRSIEALGEFRVALALYAEEALGALGAVKSEAKRTVHWVTHDRKTFWAEQVKRRREAVARRRLAKTPEHTPAMSEQKELLRQAEARLREAEAKVVLVRKWEPILQQAVLEVQASIRRISDLASGDVPRALHLLGRLVDALEAYVRVAPPSVAPTLERGSGFEAIAGAILDEEATAEPDPEPEDESDPVPPPDGPGPPA